MPTPITGQTSKSPDSKTKRGQSPLSAVSSNERNAFVVPVLHVHIAESVVNVGFWGALAGAAALGAIDLPLAALIGVGVLVARHHH
jgi:hypothetical protein